MPAPRAASLNKHCGRGSAARGVYGSALLAPAQQLRTPDLCACLWLPRAAVSAGYSWRRRRWCVPSTCTRRCAHLPCPCVVSARPTLRSVRLPIPPRSGPARAACSMADAVVAAPAAGEARGAQPAAPGGSLVNTVLRMAVMWLLMSWLRGSGKPKGARPADPARARPCGASERPRRPQTQAPCSPASWPRARPWTCTYTCPRVRATSAPWCGRPPTSRWRRGRGR